ncbi:MAG: LLM class F420-dependent oxidoreductase [Acidobacteria bacterium]|nr:MAG: LLM class F420-dependent oxidoreductase [Acidobacteriota bacterium]
MTLQLGLALGYWGAQPPPAAQLVELARSAEQLGYDSVFSAEAWGSDAFTPLAWIGAHTSRIRLGTGIVQISARTPASTAMNALTLDHLSGGRVILGLGVSGPQVVEGWYGRPFAKPLSRTREYIDIVRQILAREQPVSCDGEHYPLPYRGPGSWGLGKPLRSITHPLRSDLPIFLGAEGPKNVALAAEICDGWLPLYYSAFDESVYADSLRGRRPDFEIVYPTTLTETRSDDEAELAKALAPIKQRLAFYVGGMGAAKRNFHRELMARMGYEQESLRIQERFLEGDRAGAVAAVPDRFADDLSLVGTASRIRGRLQAWRASKVTQLLIGAGSAGELRRNAELVLG